MISFPSVEGTSNNDTYTPQFDLWPNSCYSNVHKVMQMADVVVCSVSTGTKLVLTVGSHSLEEY